MCSRPAATIWSPFDQVNVTHRRDMSRVCGHTRAHHAYVCTITRICIWSCLRHAKKNMRRAKSNSNVLALFVAISSVCAHTTRTYVKWRWRLHSLHLYKYIHKYIYIYIWIKCTPRCRCGKPCACLMLRVEYTF